MEFDFTYRPKSQLKIIVAIIGFAAWMFFVYYFLKRMSLLQAQTDMADAQGRMFDFLAKRISSGGPAAINVVNLHPPIEVQQPPKNDDTKTDQ